MMQTCGRPMGSIAWACVLWVAASFAGASCTGFGGGKALAGDRTSFLLPLAFDAPSQPAPAGNYPDDAYAGASDGWKGYMRLWKSHHEHPSDASIRRFLGLPLRSQAFSAKTGRSSPRELSWRAGSFAQVDTPHFVIYSRAGREPSMQVAEDLERCYWIWSQMFFPLWEGAAQVTTALGPIGPEQSVTEFMAASSSRITVRRKLQVVLFRNAQEYQQTLQPSVPGIERSTGYYDERKRLTFLYADDGDDGATRRHELVHQLFREATRSGLGITSPGESGGFWLVEGIAGYFESLQVGTRLATVGGWDSPRLQFARYRVLSAGDSMPMRELMADGRVAAQQRSDLARWYAHAIAQTHHLLDGSDPDHRSWVYGQLAELYKIRSELPVASAGDATNGLERSLPDFLSLDDRELIENPSARELRELCLAGCEISEKGLQTITPTTQLRWLDLARLPIGNEAVRRLAPRPESLEQLTLEATRVDDDLLDWLSRADNLEEVDLSWTPVSDAAIESLLPAPRLEVLWMTGTKVSDRSIDMIRDMPKLQSVDLQRSQVSDSSIGRLRAARPELQINPLELRAP